MTRLNLKSKESWSLKNAEIIADVLKFENTQEFREALSNYIFIHVADAKTTDFLGPIAINEISKMGCRRR